MRGGRGFRRGVVLVRADFKVSEKGVSVGRLSFNSFKKSLFRLNLDFFMC